MNTYIKKPLRYIPKGTQFILEDGNAQRRQSSIVWIKGTCRKQSGRMYATCYVAGDSKTEVTFDCNRTVFVVEKNKNKRFWSRNNTNVYTFADWKRDRSLKVKVGQFIDNETYWQLLNGVPPIQYGKVFQVGEPYTHDPKTYEDLYSTFVKKENNGRAMYQFIGYKPYNWKPNK